MHIDRLDPRNGSIIITSSNQTVKIMGRRCINRAVEGDTGQSLNGGTCVEVVLFCTLTSAQLLCACCLSANGRRPHPATLTTATTKPRSTQRNPAQAAPIPHLFLLASFSKQ